MRGEHKMNKHIILITIVFSTWILADTFHVPEDYTTIQAGIDASSDGDTVLVAPGTYIENINFNGKIIVLKSIDGPLATIIDAAEGDGWTPGIYICCGATLDGFSVINASGYNGAIIVNYDGPSTLRNLIIRDNEAAYGGGIYCYYADPLIENVTIVNNSSGAGAGINGIYGANLTIVNSIIRDNTGGPNITFSTEDCSANISYSNIINDWEGEGIIEGEGVIDLDPLFTDPENNDFSLQTNSPCIDAGTDFFVLEGDTLVNMEPNEYAGYAPDMGAVEYTCESGIYDDCWVCEGNNLPNTGVCDCLGVPFGNYGEDSCGICDDNPENDNETCSGCTDPNACNYNPEAIVNDGSCINNAGTWYISLEGVDSNCGSVEYPLTTIQAGIDASSDGDTVLVAPGTYIENINFNGKIIVLKSIDGPLATIIDAAEGDGWTPGIYICCGATLDGFSVINASGYNGAIIVNYDGPSTLRNLIIRDNEAAYGGGIYCYYADPLIENVTIVNNSSGAGAGINGIYGANLTIVNSIIRDNTGGPNITFSTEDCSANISYSNIINDWEGEGIIEGEGVIDLDPLFTDPENNDFSLQTNSPCIDAGDPESTLDPDGTIADMGALYFDQSPSYSLGDLNQDGSIDILDVVITVGIILGDEPTEWEFYAGDLNTDGLINVLDIVQLVNLILQS